MDFYRYRRGHYYSVCKKCHNARTSANPKARRHRQANNLKRRFGITPEQYEQMHEAQNGLCAICGRPESVLDRRLAVDHSHVTGEIRGLLCHSCNTGVGKLQDNPELLRKAADYLEGALKWPEQPSLQQIQR